MKAKLLLLLVSSVIFSACKKDKYATKPKIEMKSVDVREVSTANGNGTIIDINFDVLDKEGDVTDSIFILKKDAAIAFPCPGNSISNLNYAIPSYPSGNQKVRFMLKFSTLQLEGYAGIGGPFCAPRKDTSIFKFWVKDKAGNISDTVTTNPIVISL